nr:hypothetical protein [Tanacetum cinerariifolium]
MRAILKEEVNTQLPHILHQAVSDFVTHVIEKNVTESLEAAVLARSSSQPKFTYEAAALLSEFELTKILTDKIEKNKSYDKADYKRKLYDALVKSYQTDKDLFDTYDCRKEVQAEKRDYIELVDTSMRAILKEEVNTQLPHILHQAVSDFVTHVIEKNVTESLEAAVLASSIIRNKNMCLSTYHLDTQKTNELVQSSFVSSDFTSKLLNLENPSLADNEIASLMDTTICHEELGSQTSSLYIVPVMTVPDITSVLTTTISQPPPFFNPLSQQATPTPTPTTSKATTLFSSLLDFSFVFKFNDRVTNLEKDLLELKQVN